MSPLRPCSPTLSYWRMSGMCCPLKHERGLEPRSGSLAPTYLSAAFPRFTCALFERSRNIGGQLQSFSPQSSWQIR